MRYPVTPMTHFGDLGKKTAALLDRYVRREAEVRAKIEALKTDTPTQYGDIYNSAITHALAILAAGASHETEGGER